MRGALSQGKNMQRYKWIQMMSFCGLYMYFPLPIHVHKTHTHTYMTMYICITQKVLSKLNIVSQTLAILYKSLENRVNIQILAQLF